ncbi:MAG TPA: biopolymer transporter ExbD [Vitreimonas sp.]|uniref:biopolymer transporter ExbD n=1 Tax=Vitreimonas sp. TaxID=3069702 RepID=UPI002D69FDED|nr:biopolymer transporter ExbD [Vitreimonas sp.]HYD89150.1 biopolymer transporter ExbD [Vitreimonas sp.]
MTTAAAFALRKRARDLAPAAEPNVIPFIDVLLVLLIIFMVTAPKPTVDLQLQLPTRPVPVEVIIPPTIIDVDASADGYRIFIGEEEIALADVSATVMARGLAVDSVLTEEDVFAEAHVAVRARDQGVAYGAVVAVLDELKQAGFAKVGVFAQSAA